MISFLNSSINFFSDTPFTPLLIYNKIEGTVYKTVSSKFISVQFKNKKKGTAFAVPFKFDLLEIKAKVCSNHTTNLFTVCSQVSLSNGSILQITHKN